VWKALVTRVSTKYVYIARGTTYFSWHARLERLVREMRDFQADVVAGSIRTLESGEVW